MLIRVYPPALLGFSEGEISCDYGTPEVRTHCGQRFGSDGEA
jgi:hypothetical protein